MRMMRTVWPDFPLCTCVWSILGKIMRTVRTVRTSLGHWGMWGVWRETRFSFVDTLEVNASAGSPAP